MTILEYVYIIMENGRKMVVTGNWNLSHWILGGTSWLQVYQPLLFVHIMCITYLQSPDLVASLLF